MTDDNYEDISIDVLEEVDVETKEPQVEVVREGPQQEEPNVQQIGDVKVGYFVGLNEKGKFDFRVLGNHSTLVELLGLHQYANLRIQAITDDKVGSGDKLLLSVIKNQQLMGQMLDQILKSLKNPDNNPNIL